MAHHRCHFGSLVMYISGAKFNDHSSPISEIFLIQYFTILVAQFITSSRRHFPHLHNTKKR